MVQSQLGASSTKTAVLTNCTVWQFVLWCCRRRQRWEVQGLSMLPTLESGDHVLVNLQAYRLTPPQVGDIVLAQHPYQPQLHLIKRVRWTTLDHCFLQGDNSCESTDSRIFREVPLDLIIGKAISLF